MSSARTYDIVLFGATGFTGRLAADYLASVTKTTPLRWALAGRNRARLEQIQAELSAQNPHLTGDAAPAILEASSDDPASLARMARAGRVVLTTVGPYARHGEPLVEACIEARADYVDITGEPGFVNGILERHGARAREAGVRIVNCCGFDSIPHDLGALFTVEKLPRGEPITVEAVIRAEGKPSGGTWQSALNEFSQASFARPWEKDPLAEGRHVAEMPMRPRYDRQLGGWIVPLPTIDPQIVLRSARALPSYGPDFRYGHKVLVRSTAQLAAGAIGVGALFALAKIPPARSMLAKLRPSGEGPSAEERARSWFQVTFQGTAGSRRVVTRVSGGDPGYTETAKMVSESALCLALDRDKLPPHTGILTPAVAMGDLLIGRLERAGIRFELLEG
ncbi:saccharopine dehydrogenase family protein [Polyangium aurulentum]|uniref:saccharopine dehydrogenase family protein n=1 Tax=Polyangium aurulentum TaxID=2567896 RepID=UPI0010AEB5FC|nr:saccharopine dehydrogenase NADP-binding domain-containing protein [Polyangium aurulentum]UQA57594.1 saccharopine dehydrogenase NADP-binding domain-containing protein [Polyangium aurulentum]